MLDFLTKKWFLIIIVYIIYIQILVMKKVIYLVCGVLILYLIVENANFIYAENEDTQLTIEDNKIIANMDINNVEDENKIEEVPIENEEVNEIIIESNNQNLDLLDKSEEIQIFEITQTQQEINTSKYGIIRIKDPDPNNKWKWITIHDRNLWATATWAWVDESRKSFWYYFQWWNNYWFPTTWEIEKVNTNPVDASSYWPENPYSSDTFIVWNDDWSNVHNDNLRWWSGDSQNNNGYPVVNFTDRQWPCPAWYHVPSIWEWSKLLEFWATEYGNVSLSRDGNELNKFRYDNEIAANEFYKKFFIPLAGWYDNNVNIKDSNSLLLFWSSSPINLEDAFRLYWNFTVINSQYINKRSYAFPVRCFYNSYRLPVRIKYEVNWWYWVDHETTEDKVITYTKDDDISEYSWDAVLWAIKRGNNCWEDRDKKCIFGWWHTLTGDKMWTWNITEDITLYAKRLEFDDKDVSYSGTSFIVMDRNLWAINSWTDEYAYGYYLTWWEKDIICPEWYHIPNTWEWLWVKKLLGSDFNWELVKDLFNFPFAGKSLDGEIVETWVNGYYLAKDWDEINYAKISNSGIEIENLDEWEKVSVRCFKDYNTWTIKFNTNGWWDGIDDIIAVNWREEWEDLQVPERDNSIFSWWFTTSGFQEWTKLEKNINYKNEEEINLYAKWKCVEWYQENVNICEKISKPSGWSSGGRGWWGISKGSDISSWTNVKDLEWDSQDSFIDFNSSVTTGQLPLEKEHNNGKRIVSPSQGGMSEGQGDLLKDFSQEFIDAYNFAYKNWITTKKSIYDAKMYSPLTRIQMAKMLSNYAINVLWKEPDISKWVIKFKDVSDKLNKEYDNAVNLAYQLGIMWQNIKNNKFRPYDEVTRAEFATALSRLLYWTKDWKWQIKYYEPHISKLHNEWIINRTNPTIKEKRWYIMIMLMRIEVS